MAVGMVVAVANRATFIDVGTLGHDELIFWPDVVRREESLGLVLYCIPGKV
jgi:hypothetical protein